MSAYLTMMHVGHSTTPSTEKGGEQVEETSEKEEEDKKK